MPLRRLDLGAEVRSGLLDTDGSCGRCLSCHGFESWHGISADSFHFGIPSGVIFLFSCVLLSKRPRRLGWTRSRACFLGDVTRRCRLGMDKATGVHLNTPHEPSDTCGGVDQ